MVSGSSAIYAYLIVEGFLNLDVHDLVRLGSEGEDSYKAEVRISQPNFKEDNQIVGLQRDRWSLKHI